MEFVELAENVMDAATKDLLERQASGQLVILENLGLVDDGWGNDHFERSFVIAYKKKDKWKTATIIYDESGNWKKLKRSHRVMFMLKGEPLQKIFN